MCSSLIEPSQFAVWINTVNAIEQSEWKFQPFSLTVNMSLTKRQWSPSLKFPFGNLHSREPNEMPVKISSNGLSTAKAYGLRMRVGNKKRSDSPMYSLFFSTLGSNVNNFMWQNLSECNTFVHI